MLIAPIFKVDYLQNDSQNNRIRDVPSNNNNNGSSDNIKSNTYNIFKTAINRGTELIKNTFLSKNTSLCSDTVNRCGTQLDSENETSSDESDSDSENSSPDSIQTELMYFKPIATHPRTMSTNTTKILRLPSIHSTSSNSTVYTPCPSPFFIPITPQRQSAFSFVGHDKNQQTKKIMKKPKSTKRKNLTPVNQKADELAPKRKKNDRRKYTDIKDSNIKRKTDDKSTGEARGVRTRRQKACSDVKKVSVQKQKGSKKCTQKENQTNGQFRRVTRSMKN